MDKQKVKIILIAIAVLLAIFLLYRTLSRVSDNKTAAAGKIDSANADLTIKQNQDAYIAERELQKKSDEETKVGYLSEAQKADGIDSLNAYLATLKDAQKEKYKQTRSEYIRVMGVDPGLMSYEDLMQWQKDYISWSNLNNQYIKLTGETKSMLDPDYDTVEEMQAAVLSAKSAIENALDQAWIDEYELFCNDREGFKGVPYFSLPQLQKWLPSPDLLLPLQQHMTGLYDSYIAPNGKFVKATSAYKRLFNYFLNDEYIHNLNGNGELKHVRGCNDISDALYQELNGYSVNEFAMITGLLRQDGGVNVYTAVNTNNSVDKDSKTRFFNFYEASLGVAAFYYSYQNSTNIFGAIASLGISAAIQKNNKVKNYVPEHLNQLMSRMERGGEQTFTPFGYTVETMESLLARYSHDRYHFPDWVWESIELGQMDINDWINSDEYQNSIYK